MRLRMKTRSDTSSTHPHRCELRITTRTLRIQSDVFPRTVSSAGRILVWKVRPRERTRCRFCLSMAAPKAESGITYDQPSPSSYHATPREPSTVLNGPTSSTPPEDPLLPTKYPPSSTLRRWTNYSPTSTRESMFLRTYMIG